jgi:ribosomal protein L21E
MRGAMAQTKAELVEELEAQATKADLIDLLQSRLLKDDLAKLLEDESGATKEELVHKLESLKKDELVEAVASHVNKEHIQKVVEENRDDEDEDEDDEEPKADAQEEAGDGQDEQDEKDEPQRDESTDIDWSAELDWAPPPRPTPAPVQFAGAAPFQPGQRVRVDVAGLPMLGVFAGKGASAAGTIVAVDARAREVRVYLDAVFDGEKEIAVPPERVQPDA